MAEEQPTPEAAAGRPQVEFSLARIYLKDLSFEVPQGAEGFRRQWKPKVGQELATRIKKLEGDHYEVALALTVSVKDGEETLYLVEVEQAGIFLVRGLEGDQLAAVLNVQCPQILFPYARELVDNLVVRGTFPPLMLPPINFEAVYRQALANARAQQGAGSAGQASA
ncbi:MAG: protein-export protein SecB [Porticoccaceae bacterium]|nr:MAG: protein-export protein SecB [Porticoccaceae bacterium]